MPHVIGIMPMSLVYFFKEVVWQRYQALHGPCISMHLLPVVLIEIMHKCESVSTQRKTMITKNLLPSILLISSFALSAQAAVVFQQDFSSSSSLSSYLGNGANQFAFSENVSSASSNFSISSNTLIATRDVGQTPSDTYASLRAEVPAGNLSGSITTGFKMTLDVSVFDYTTSAPVLSVSAGYVAFGNLQGATASFNTRPVSATDFYVTGNSNSWNTGSPTTVTWVVNNTGSNYIYTAPDASSRTLATGNYDLWIGSNALGSGSLGSQTYSVNSNGFNAFQIQVPGWSGANAALSVDNIVVSTIPEPSAFLLLGLACTFLIVFRRRRALA